MDAALNEAFSGDYAPGATGYLTEEAAATGWADIANPLSINADLEVGAKIFSNPDSGKYYCGRHVIGTRGSVDTESALGLSGMKLTATIHTHGAQGIGPSADQFSGMNARVVGGRFIGDRPSDCTVTIIMVEMVMSRLHPVTCLSLTPAPIIKVMSPTGAKQAFVTTSRG